MKYKLLLFCLCQMAFIVTVLAADSSFTKTPDGVIVYTAAIQPNGPGAVKLEVVADNIIRVLVAPDKEITPTQSLITVPRTSAAVSWTLAATRQTLTVKTKRITATVDITTGVVTFRDAAGRVVLGEKKTAGRQFSPAVFDGQRLYDITQSFDCPAGDAWYGLGQHQSGVMNYRGQRVEFFQNNTEVAVPFLISNKNYGILWDNYSLTTAGDTRPLHPLSAFMLRSKTGEQGWLTASYANNKNKPEEVAVVRPEQNIAMEFLGESKTQLPEGFTPATGMVTWEGSISSALNGVCQLRWVFGGTLKVWLNGKLVAEHWRKAWNPAPLLIPVQLQAGVQIPVRIEWIPEGAESYLSVKWQEPITAAQQNTFSFQSEAGRQVDYYFVYGSNMDEVIAGYRNLTGKAPIVPKWALGFWQSRERYKTQNELLTTMAEFRKRKIPIDNIVLDWSYWKEAEWGSQEFDAARFPAPDSMIQALHKQYNAQVMISVWPKFYEGIPAYDAFNSKGWLYKRNIADRQRDWIGKGYVSTFYDAFNAEARKGFWDLIYQKIYTKGIDAWWMDASEPDILSNVDPAKRKQQMTPVALGTAAEYLNAYPLQNAKGIYEGQRAADPDKRVFLLTRSGFAGSQRYAAAIWSGDIGATWRDMKAQIAAGVNFSMSGIPYWTMDIGGFVVPEKFEKPNEAAREEWRELMTRWSQFGAFVPLFRSHGQFPYREVFNTAPEEHAAYKSFLYYDRLRYRLIPYIYSLAGAVYHDNYTMMRGLAMDFPNDTAVLNSADQFMFGPSFLVNPVTEYGQRSRPVYLPKGSSWYDMYTGKWYAGGHTLSAEAGYERMPVFVKAGAIVPFGPELQYTAEKPADTLDIHIYRGADGSFQLYEDEGLNYNYEKGAYSTIPLAWSEAAGTLTVGERQGSYKGMQQQRTLQFYIHTRNNTSAWDAGKKPHKVVVYRGKKTIIRM